MCNSLKRFLSLVLAGCLMISILPVTGFAADGCENHTTHDDLCGYQAGTEEAPFQPCTHQCEACTEPVEQPEIPVCSCESACTDEVRSSGCPVCGAEGAALESCGKYEAPPVPADAAVIAQPEEGAAPEPVVLAMKIKYLELDGHQHNRLTLDQLAAIGVYTSDGVQLHTGNLADYGLTEMPTWQLVAEAGAEYTLEITLPGADASGSAVSWVKPILTQMPSREDYVIQEGSGDIDYFYNQETVFTASAKYRTGSVDQANALGIPAALGTSLQLLADGQPVSGYGFSFQEITALEQAGFVIQDLPMFHEDMTMVSYTVQHAITDSSNAKKLPLAGGDGDWLEITYDNAAAVNANNTTDYLCTGGTYEIALKGTATFAASKLWLDEKTGDQIATRPDLSFALWRYSPAESYSAAAPAVDPVTKAFVTLECDPAGGAITLPAELEGKLDKYNPDGTPYIYVARETLIYEEGDDRYEQAFGMPGAEGFADTIAAETLLTADGSRTGGHAGNSYVYHGGTICNRITGKVDAVGKKSWNASTYASEFGDVTVQLTLQRRSKNLADSAWEDTQVVKTLQFLSEYLVESQCTQTGLPHYDTMGREWEYQWVETAVFQGGSDNLLNEGISSLTFQDGRRISFQAKPQGTEFADNTYTTAIVNDVAAIVSFELEKKWEGLEGTAWAEGTKKAVFVIQQVAPDGSERTVARVTMADNRAPALELTARTAAPYLIFHDKDSGARVGLTSDSSTHQWHVTLNNLPEFNAAGSSYFYKLVEVSTYLNDVQTPISRSYSQSKTTATVLDNFQTHYQAAVVNRPGTGKTVLVEKIWLDDSDTSHRGDVRVALYGTKSEGGAAEQIAAVTLTEAAGWYQFVGVEAGTTVTHIRELSVGGQEVTHVSDAPMAEGRYASEHHEYEVFYHSESESKFTVTNRRIGRVDIRTAKTWKDGENEGGIRDSLYSDGGARLAVQLSLAQAPEGYTLTDTGVTGTADAAAHTQALWQYPVADLTLIQTMENLVDQSFAFQGLPAYDQFGGRIQYEVREIWVDENSQPLAEGDPLPAAWAAYSCEAVSQEEGAGTDFLQQVSLTNRLRGSTDVTWYKVWKDQFTFAALNRPDIYLDIYQVTYDHSAALHSVTPFQMDYRWVQSSDNPTQQWSVTLEDVPEYDPDGRKYYYYAVEQSLVNVSSYDYLAPLYSHGTQEWGTSEVLSVTAEEAGIHVLDLSAKARTPGFTHQFALLSGGTFTNVLEQSVTIQGQKLWRNLPEHFNEAHLPEIAITVYQKVKDSQEEPIPVAYLEKQDWVTGDESYSFTITCQSVQGESGTWTPTDRPLPKYDPEGRIYEYSIREEVFDRQGNLLGDSFHGSTPREGDIYQATCLNFALENDYMALTGADITGSADVTISEDAPLAAYPGFTFTLTRSYEDSSGQLVQETGYSRKTVWKSSDVEAAHKNGTKIALDLEFSDLEALAPNGAPYQYSLALDDSQLGGYSIAVNGSPVLPGKAAVKNILVTEGAAMPEIAISVTRDNPAATVDLTAQKQWVGLDGKPDTDEWLGNRPESLTLTLYRSASQQTGQNNPVSPWQICRDAAGNPVTAVVSAETGWRAVFSGMETYAPNGMPWKYKIIEEDNGGKHTVPLGYQVKDTAAVVTANAAGADGLIMTLTNTAQSATAVFRKEWVDQEGAIGVDHLGFAVEASFALKVRQGDGQWQSWQDFFARAEDAPVKTLTGSITDPTAWRGTFSALPRFYQGQRVQYLAEEIGVTADGMDISQLFTAASAAGSSETTITNVFATTSVTIASNWEGDSGNSYETRPEAVSFLLQRRLGADDPWTTVTSAGENGVISGQNTIEDLPRSHVHEGVVTDYQYRVMELSADGTPLEEGDPFHTAYQVSYAIDQDAEGNYTALVTNTMITQNLSAQKNWAPGSTPVKIKLVMTVAGKSFPVELDGIPDENPGKPYYEDRAWHAVWNQVPVQHPADSASVCQVLEEVPVGYTASYYEDAGVWHFENSQVVNATVSKTWEYWEHMTTPQQTTVVLVRRTEGTAWAPVEGKTAVLTPQKQEHSVDGLPKCDDLGQPYTYAFRETDGTGILEYDCGQYNVIYRDSESQDSPVLTFHTDIRNVGKTKVTVVQNWDDFSNKHQTRPDTVTVSLLAGKEQVAQLTISGTGDAWQQEAAQLPRVDEDGAEIQYTVSMEPVSGYDMTHSDGSFAFGHKLNRLQEIPVVCSWTDNENAFQTRPEAVDIELWAEGKLIRAARLDSASDWKNMFRDVPIYDEESGETIAYTLQAASVEGYDVTVTAEGNGFHLRYVGHGALTVTKKVAGNLGEKTRSFHFTVELSDATVTGTYGGMAFAAGTAEFTLRHGEGITATGLPAGVTYIVSEAEANRYGYTTKSDGDSGTIGAGSISTASFTNRKDDPSLPQTGQLNWPVPVLLGGGSLLLALSWILGRKKRR